MVLVAESYDEVRRVYVRYLNLFGLLVREAQSASDADVKAYAARSLPTLREHLALARQVNSEVTLGPTVVPSAMAAAVVVPWCQGAYAPTAGTNFGNCAPAK